MLLVSAAGFSSCVFQNLQFAPPSIILTGARPPSNPISVSFLPDFETRRGSAPKDSRGLYSYTYHPWGIVPMTKALPVLDNRTSHSAQAYGIACKVLFHFVATSEELILTTWYHHQDNPPKQFDCKQRRRMQQHIT